jgi:hypothetical protein
LFYELFCFNAVKGKAVQRKTKSEKEVTNRSHGTHFTGVTDSRNRKIRRPGVTEITTLLKQSVRDQKAGEKEVQSVRQTLRSLQSVRI